MPMYEYFCESCDFVFTAMNSVSRHREPSICPNCQGAATRIISAPRLNTMRDDVRKAHQVNERSAHAPRVSHQHQCGPGCNHHSNATTAPLKQQNGVKRPWMLGH